MFFRRKSHLKRFMVRLGLLGIAGVLGFIAIAQAQRSGDTPADEAAAAADDPATAVAGAEGAELVTAAADTAAPPNFAQGAPPQFATTPPPTSPPQALAGNYETSDAGPPTALAAATAASPNRLRAASAARSSPAARPDPFGLAAASTPTDASGPAVATSPGADRYRELYAATDDRYETATEPQAAPPAETEAAPRADNFGPSRPAPLDNEASLTAPGDGAPPSQPISGEFPDANETAAPAAIEDRILSRPLGSGRSNPFARDEPRARTEPTFDRPAARLLESEPREPVQLAGRFADTSDVAAEGQGRPGGRHLEGPQAPKLLLEKNAPAEIQVGAPSTFEILVRNTGSVAAQDVRVHDIVPRGAKLARTKPEARVGGDGAVVWLLGTLEANEERVMEMEIIPQREGEIGSVASLTFRADASARSTVTKPELQLEVSGPRQVMIGDRVTMVVRVTNVGSGVASHVLLYDPLPAELKHPAGAEVEFDVGELQPNETREIELMLTAAQPGRVSNQVTAKGEGQVAAQAALDVEIVAPALQVTLEGPRKRYLERKATYTLSVANPGTAPARGVQLVSHLPKGIEFVSANNRGRYDDDTHAVYWSLAELPEGEVGTVKLVTLPVEAGQHKIRLEGRAESDLSDRREEVIVVEGLSAIFFEVIDVEDPVEVGGETEYEIRVVNQGTKTATNIRLAALVPRQLQALTADGPTRHQMEGGRVFFEPLPRLAPKADTTYRIKVRGEEAGDQRFRVQLQSDEMDSPVTKEESTRVYADG
ncbi:MAG: hypothetical protein OES79_06960 [Planctomycetota bacterium]|nr:hypothetical protein [Planctomycetota bacterium]